jgi:hypothetical protein
VTTEGILCPARILVLISCNILATYSRTDASCMHGAGAEGRKEEDGTNRKSSG